ncbi:nuclear transport factor 2 family protein [Actinomadura gamaensis]|uniref:Nuclear transport factor 2 family protein n=1 Tax=Actinomadura gamaensis TaxID=1763541 RepID=A0ABV9TZP7_9ACTN
MVPHDPTPDTRLATLADRAEITALLDRYARALDDRALPDRALETTLPGLLTPDVTVGPPADDHSGLSEATRHLTESLASFGATQHSYTNYLIDLDGDEAAIRANSFAACVLVDSGDLRTTGGVLTAEATRTPYGWRLRSVTIAPTWETTASLPSGKREKPSGTEDASTETADSPAEEPGSGEPETP